MHQNYLQSHEQANTCAYDEAMFNLPCENQTESSWCKMFKKLSSSAALDWSLSKQEKQTSHAVLQSSWFHPALQFFGLQSCTDWSWQASKCSGGRHLCPHKAKCVRCSCQAGWVTVTSPLLLGNQESACLTRAYQSCPSEDSFWWQQIYKRFVITSYSLLRSIHSEPVALLLASGSSKTGGSDNGGQWFGHSAFFSQVPSWWSWTNNLKIFEAKAEHLTSRQCRTHASRLTSATVPEW